MYSLFLDEILISKAHKEKPHKQIKSGRRRFFSQDFSSTLSYSLYIESQTKVFTRVYHNKV